MIMAARLKAGWVTEEDLAPPVEEEADAESDEDVDAEPVVINVIEGAPL